MACIIFNFDGSSYSSLYLLVIQMKSYSFCCCVSLSVQRKRNMVNGQCTKFGRCQKLHFGGGILKVSELWMCLKTLKLTYANSKTLSNYLQVRCTTICSVRGSSDTLPSRQSLSHDCAKHDVIRKHTNGVKNSISHLIIILLTQIQ